MAALGAPPEWQNVIRARLMAQQNVNEPLKDVIEQCKFTILRLELTRRPETGQGGEGAEGAQRRAAERRWW